MTVSFHQVKPSFYCIAAAAAQSQGLFLLIAAPDGFLSTESCACLVEAVLHHLH